MLARLISTVGLSALRREVAASVGRAGRRVGLYVAAAVLWLAASAFLLAALSAWLAGQLGTIAALAIVGGALAAIALIVHLGLVLSAHRRARPDYGEAIAGLTGTGGSSAGPGADLGALAIVALVGWLLGRQMSGK
jgi:hypothetical protein